MLQTNSVLRGSLVHITASDNSELQKKASVNALYDYKL